MTDTTSPIAPSHAEAAIPIAPGRTPWKHEAVGFVLGFVLLALLPLIFGDTYARHILIMAFIYAIVASNWDLSLGYGGVFNFGHLALFGIDAVIVDEEDAGQAFGRSRGHYCPI